MNVLIFSHWSVEIERTMLLTDVLVDRHSEAVSGLNPVCELTQLIRFYFV